MREGAWLRPVISGTATTEAEDSVGINTGKGWEMLALSSFRTSLLAKAVTSCSREIDAAKADIHRIGGEESGSQKLHFLASKS